MPPRDGGALLGAPPRGCPRQRSIFQAGIVFFAVLGKIAPMVFVNGHAEGVMRSGVRVPRGTSRFRGPAYCAQLLASLSAPRHQSYSDGATQARSALPSANDPANDHWGACRRDARGRLLGTFATVGNAQIGAAGATSFGRAGKTLLGVVEQGSAPGNFGQSRFGGAGRNPFEGVGTSPFGGMQQQEPTDKFLTDRFPALAKYKMAIMGIVFVTAFFMGWVGRWGVFFGIQSKSYFDILGIPLRALPGSPCFDSPFVYCQFYVDLMVRAPKFIRKLLNGTLLKEMREKVDMARSQQGGFAQQSQGPNFHRQQGTPPASAGADVWQTARDPASGRTYYFNTATRQTAWDNPSAGRHSGSDAVSGDVIDV